MDPIEIMKVSEEYFVAFMDLNNNNKKAVNSKRYASMEQKRN
jgi:hypothetical protein